MSFAEFSYPLMQAWDWWQLFDQRDVQLQIGGSDQYGNIITGIEGVEHVANQRLDPIEKTKFGPLAKRFGLTIPLITTASGEKFGKSAGNAVWLDPELTPIFEQYQVCTSKLEAELIAYADSSSSAPPTQTSATIYASLLSFPSQKSNPSSNPTNRSPKTVSHKNDSHTKSCLSCMAASKPTKSSTHTKCSSKKGPPRPRVPRTAYPTQKQKMTSTLKRIRTQLRPTPRSITRTT